MARLCKFDTTRPNEKHFLENFLSNEIFDLFGGVSQSEPKILNKHVSDEDGISEYSDRHFTH